MWDVFHGIPNFHCADKRSRYFATGIELVSSVAQYVQILNEQRAPHTAGWCKLALNIFLFSSSLGLTKSRSFVLLKYDGRFFCG